MPKHSNDNDTPHVILEEDRAGNVRPVLAPLPVPVIDSDRAFWDAWKRDRAGTMAIIDEMNRRTSRELLNRAIAAAMRKRAA